MTTLTKVSAEELCEFLEDQGVRAKYMHSDIKAEDRVEIINGLRAGEFDVLVGISLLREGLDIPEASLVAIVDADQAGFLRSSQALIQMIGRAARNSRGKAIMYADTITSAMRQAISETDDRRQHQIAFNEEFGITPSTSRGMLGSTEARPDRSQAHSAEFCASLEDLCDRITSKERRLLDLSDAGDEEEIEFVRLELTSYTANSSTCNHSPEWWGVAPAGARLFWCAGGARGAFHWPLAAARNQAQTQLTELKTLPDC